MKYIVKVAYIILLLNIQTSLRAQSINEIKSDHSYIWGEGYHSSQKRADNMALDELISQISVKVESDFSQLSKNVVTGETPETEVTCKSVIKTYSGATLNNAKKIEFYNEKEGKYTIFRYIHRSEIDKVFESRRHKVISYVKDALEAVKRKEIDNALRNYNWALILLQSLPRPGEITFKNNNEEVMLVTWIPKQIRNIFSNLQVSLSENDISDGLLELIFRYDGVPVSSIDFKYFDGQSTSAINSASNGKGACEVNPKIPISYIDVMCEYIFREKVHVDNEMQTVMNTIGEEEYFARESRYRVPLSSVAAHQPTNTTNIQAKTVNKVTQYDTSTSHAYTTVNQLNIDAKKSYDDIVTTISSAIKSKNYDLVKSHFTEEGWNMFSRLIAYGNAQLLTPTERVYLQADNWIICRSLPMQFSFSNNTRKFVEDVNFTFNIEKKIESITFGLGYEALNDIWSHEEWPQTSRLFLINFLENYKTAFALKRIEYIADIFDDNAVIIIGNKTKRAAGDVELDNFSNNEIVIYNRLTKNQYINNLKRCFRSNEFVNICFGNNRVMRASGGGELYGIEIKQDYYSTNYGDQGYLFLMVDLNNTQKPSIKVRTWQPEKDPNFGLYGLGDF